MGPGGRVTGFMLVVGGSAGCFSDRPATAPPPPGGGVAVAIHNFAYVPPGLTVAAGEPVTWTNDDDAGHTITADDRSSFASSVVRSGGTFRMLAPAPGVYGYHCSIHPFMRASLTVTAP